MDPIQSIASVMSRVSIKQFQVSMGVSNALFSRTYALRAEKYAPIGVLKMDFVLAAYAIATLMI